MGKKKKSWNLFKESIDPRFSGVFNPDGDNNAREKFSVDSQLTKKVEKYSYSRVNGNIGFRNFIGIKLAEYLDKHTKEVDRPVLENDFFANKIDRIRLFSDSDIITENEPVELIQQKPAKKKSKKERSDGSFKEVAVSYEWIQKQAQMLRS